LKFNMVNLLPEEYKKRLKNQKIWNFFLSFEMVLFLICLLAVVGLFLLEFYFKSVQSYNANMLEAVKSDSSQIDQIRKEIDILNKETILANQIISNQSKISPWFRKIVSDMSPGMNLKYFSFKKKENNFDVSIVGYAPDNDSIVSFKNNLEKDFSVRIDLPLDALTKRRDIDFTINFSLPIK